MSSAPLGTEPLPTPDDHAQYWADALADADRYPLALHVEPVATALETTDVYDVSFAGSGGRRVSAWLRVPRVRTAPMPAVVHANGYGAGRLEPVDDLTWSAAGYVHLVLGTHGQGAGSSGHILDGILQPERSYYRGVFVDGARAVAAVRALDVVDPMRVAMIGNSQGGAIALGVGALVSDLVGVFAQAPFLTHAPEALRRATAGPWTELRRFLDEDPDRAQAVASTLAYVDGVTSARHATAPGWLSAGLDDTVCPPETTNAAAAAYRAPVRHRAWPGAGHEAGATADRLLALAALRRLFERPAVQPPPPIGICHEEVRLDGGQQ